SRSPAMEAGGTLRQDVGREADPLGIEAEHGGLPLVQPLCPLETGEDHLAGKGFEMETPQVDAMTGQKELEPHGGEEILSQLGPRTVEALLAAGGENIEAPHGDDLDCAAGAPRLI